nr:NnrS family protein [Solemya velum gill symbiont]
MIFGYAMAVVAGFLLTAVSNWTSVPTWKGWRLALLVSLWVVARVALLLPIENALLLAAVADLLFGIGLIVGVSLPVLRVKMWKQAGILVKLVLMFVANLLFYAGALDYMELSTHIGLYGIYMILALLFMMMRRVLPFFIERGAGDGFKPRNRKWLDISSIVLFALWVLADLFMNSRELLAGFSLLLFVLHLVRLRDWHTPAIWKDPLLWSLYTAYIALAIAFLLKALSAWSLLSPSLALHAFAVGGIGVMTLGMMSRVTLGYTGRDIFTPPRGVVIVFILLLLGFLFRVVMPIVAARDYMLWIGVSQVLWMASFAGFSIIYLPQLVRARIDGRPG